MLKLRIGVIAATAAFALATGASTAGATGGDPNAGDVWVDNVGQPAGPGHEMDPHLACQDIILWGSGLADSSGTFTIDGWPPTGSMEQDYPASGSATWTYNQSQGGTQMIALISVRQLISDANQHGDIAQAQNGDHFKLILAQDPQKAKTFWVNCNACRPW